MACIHTYESNRLALNNLIDAYEKLLPRRKYKMKNKKLEMNDEFETLFSYFRRKLKMITAALYARVSSEKQAQENTIASQVEALKSRIIADDLSLLDEHQFIDNGYSGSNFVRPALEKLRDQIAAGIIDKIYIHSPDRLSRKYAYQMILIEEFERME